MYGYVYCELKDNNCSERWSGLFRAYDSFITLHLNKYAFAIQEWELATKYPINKRDKNTTNPSRCDRICQLCYANVEDITHIISRCSKMSTRYYLPSSNEIVAKTVYKVIGSKDCLGIYLKACQNQRVFTSLIAKNTFGTFQ